MPYKFVPRSFHTGVTAEALRAKIERKSTISHKRGHFYTKILGRRGRVSRVNIKAKYTRCFRKKTSTHIIGYKLRNSGLILIIFDTKIPHII